MIVRKNLDVKVVVFYSWKTLLYYFVLAVAVYLVHTNFVTFDIHIPSYTITILSAALAIFLGFNNNQAYDRWWEARKIWGLLVNFSRAWARQVITFMKEAGEEDREAMRELQKRMIYRHSAFVHALRVFLRERHDYNEIENEYMEEENRYSDTKDLLIPTEYKTFSHKDNPPNYLIQLQGEDLKRAADQGWLSDFRFMQLDQTLVEFNNIQGKSERIKNTPMPRPYTFFARVFVFLHATLLPFAFVADLGWAMIPVVLIISFVFKALDTVGERTEDPFENRMDDTPMTSLSVTIERNVKEQWGERNLPKKPLAQEGIVF